MQRAVAPRWMLFVVLVAIANLATGAEIWPTGLSRIRERNATEFLLTDNGQAAADLTLLADDELVTNAAQWMQAYVERETGTALALGGAERLQQKANHVVGAVGESHPLIKRLVAEGKLQLEPLVGDQGFVIQRVTDMEAGELLVCWSPAPLGCRYGLIELLRSLSVKNRTVHTSLKRVVDRPQFPLRICYLNFAQHLENAYNPNVLFDVPINRWQQSDWERWIDMVSAFRYNAFEFWLVPSLFSPEALRGGKIQAEFAETMNQVIAYAKRRGVSVYPIHAVNCVGSEWHYHCPHTPGERDELIALWDHWSRTLEGYDYMGLFPGDPGGCLKNGCTAETFVDLSLELSQVIRRNNPDATIEVGTWGSPFAGWGVPLWTGTPERAEKSMNYFLDKLSQFPPGTIVSINQGFNPDAIPTADPGQRFPLAGGDARPYAQRAAKTHTVLTWDYSATEGEGTVMPHCRVRRILQRRREELALGCYSGGICYTMTPQLNALSIYCCAEAYWNPQLEPQQILSDYGRLVFGDPLAPMGPLLEEFEVMPGWGYYPPFPYTPRRLQESMAKLLALLNKVDSGAESRLPLSTSLSEYRDNLVFFAELFRKCSMISADLEEGSQLARDSGKVAADHQGLLSVGELDQLLADSSDFPQKARLAELTSEIKSLDIRQLRDDYWDRVYGIYDHIPHPGDPRAEGATQELFKLFHYDLAIVHSPTPLEVELHATGKPYLCLNLGNPISERDWSLRGWSNADHYQGESWRASFDEPGVIRRDDFRNEGYGWLVVRLCEGPAGGRKTISINGQQVAVFERTGPSRDVKPEWWVTRCWPIPAGLLRDGSLEIRFADSGIGIASVALAVERPAPSPIAPQE